MIERVAIPLLRRDGGTQIRKYNPAVGAAYARLMVTGTIFPPVRAYFDGAQYWLADGFHRIAAALLINDVAIDADIRSGARQSAIFDACCANSGPSDWRTSADKRTAIATLLEYPQWLELSDRSIANACGVGRDMVGRLRRSSCSERTHRRRVMRGGSKFLMNIVGINQHRTNRSDVGSARHA